MWFVEIFTIFYDKLGFITRMEIMYSIEEYMQYGALAAHNGLELLPVVKATYDKVLRRPRDYKVINGEVKYIVQYPVL